MIHKSLTELIGHTPLLEVCRLERSEGLQARLLVKIESFNPGGSAKDRVALAMIEAAERRGELRPGGTIVEPTSGNTGVGLAWVARTRGYRVVLTMPESMSLERRRLLAALGAELVLTPAGEGMGGALRRAEQLLAETPGAWMAGQFSNPANPAAHEATTACEIWSDTDGHVDLFVAAVGTGGTFSGTVRALRRLNPQLQAVAVEPAGSPVLSGGKPGGHKIQGIGAGFVPQNFCPELADRILQVTDDEAAAATRLLARQEGLLCGISSGAALSAAMRLAREAQHAGKTIVCLLPDTGERYLSTQLFEESAQG